MKQLVLAASVALTVACTSALAADLPDLKAGLWELSTSVSKGAAPISTTMCMDNSVYQRLDEQIKGNPQRPCKRISEEHVALTYTAVVECNFRGKPMRSITVMTTSGNTAYHSEIHSDDQAVGIVIDAKYLGTCPTSMKLGDMTGPDGKVMLNILK